LDSRSYTSHAGYLMRGGSQRITRKARTTSWISFGLVVGAAVVLATYLVAIG